MGKKINAIYSIVAMQWTGPSSFCNCISTGYIVKDNIPSEQAALKAEMRKITEDTFPLKHGYQHRTYSLVVIDDQGDVNISENDI